MSSINARVPPPRLMAIDTPSDGQIPAYQASSGEFEWVDDSSGAPGGATTQIQYNNSGAFAGDAGLIISTAGGGASTQIQVGSLKVGGSVNALAQQTLNGSLLLQPEGTGQLTISPGAAGGGTQSDIQVNVQKQTPTDEAIIQLNAATGTVDIAKIKLDAASDLILDNSYNTNKDLDLKIAGTGQVEIANQTTNTDTILSVKGNGTGDAKINLNNPTKAITLICDTNQKLKVAGGVNSFVFDASSGTGGITWPDGTTQTTAATGVTWPLVADASTETAPAYTFTGDTNTGMFSEEADEINFTMGGSRKITFDPSGITMNSGQIFGRSTQVANSPAYSIGGDSDSGMFRADSDVIGISTGGVERIRFAAAGQLGIGGANYGTDGQVLTSTGASTAPAWEDAGGGDSAGALGNPTVMDSTSQKFNANQRIGGGTYAGTTAIEYFYGPVAYPFVSPHTGTIADLTIEVTTAAAGRSADIGIYSTDATTGLPSSLIASANFSVASAAQVTQTSFTGTPAVTRGTLYWIAQFSDTNTSGSGSVKARENNVSFNPPSNIPIGLISSKYFSSLPNSVYFDGETSLPASVTASDCIGINRDLIDVIIGW
jgi:hypothetical protein